MKLLTSSLLIALTTFFISCGENTTTPIIAGLTSLDLDENTKDLVIYSTDAPTEVEAWISYDNNESKDATLEVKWSSIYDILVYSTATINGTTKGTIWGGRENGGISDLNVTHGVLNDTTTVKVIKLTSFDIASSITTTTGEHTLIAKGDFENNTTDRLIVKNIVWSANNDAIITQNKDNYEYTIDIIKDTNVTATMFGDTNNTSLIKPQTILIEMD